MEAALRRGGIGNIHEPDPKGGPAAASRCLTEKGKLLGRDPLHEDIHDAAADHVGIRCESGHVEMHQAGGSALADGQARRQHVRFDLTAADGPDHGQVPRDQHLRARMARGGAGTIDDRGKRQKFSLFKMLGNVVFQLHANRLVMGNSFPQGPRPCHICFTVHDATRSCRTDQGEAQFGTQLTETTPGRSNGLSSRTLSQTTKKLLVSMAGNKDSISAKVFEEGGGEVWRGEGETL